MLVSIDDKLGFLKYCSCRYLQRVHQDSEQQFHICLLDLKPCIFESVGIDKLNAVCDLYKEKLC